MFRIILAAALVWISAADAAEGPAKFEWKRRVGKPAGSTWLAVQGDTLLTTTWTGDLKALFTANGRTRWRQALGENAHAAAVSGVVIHADKKTLVARDVAKGEVLWTHPIAAAPTSVAACRRHALAAATFRAPTQAGETLVVHAVAPETGAPLWQVPAKGELVAGTDNHLVVAANSDKGLLKGELEAIRCVDGQAVSIPSADRPFVRFMDLKKNRLLSLHFRFGFKDELLCVTDLATREQQCFAPAEVAPKPFAVSAASLGQGGDVLFSVHHETAHNLDPSDDSWLMAYDLNAKRVRTKTDAMIASIAPLSHGDLVVSSFGSTGAKDTVTLLDRKSLAVLGQFELAKSPNLMAFDHDRAYVASYDGLIQAVRLPRPGPDAITPAPVTPRPIEAAPQETNLGWVEVLNFKAHPKTARTSNQYTDGTVTSVAWVGKGAHLVTGGNDDHARIFDAHTGDEEFESRPLGFDVQQVQGCRDEDLVFVRTYKGRLFTIFGRDWAHQRKITHGFGWMSGITRSCTHLIADDFDGKFTIYDTATGKTTGEIFAPGTFDRRGLRLTSDAILVQDGKELKSWFIAGARGPFMVKEGSMRVDLQRDGAPITQAWQAGNRTLVEYCNAEICTVELVAKGKVTERVKIDVRGSAWAADVPSFVRISSDERTLFFHRDGLSAYLIDMKTDKRQRIGQIPRTMAGTPSAAFSPEGDRLAVAMYPEPNRVTIFERKK